MKKFLLSLLMFIVAVPLWAHDFEVDGIYYNITDDTALTVAVTYRGTTSDSYSDEYTGAVTIPSSVTYNGTTYSVTTIDYTAFRNCTSLTEVTIPNSVTTIGERTFEKCNGLTEVTIPNSVTSIGSKAFYSCAGLTEVNFNAENCTFAGGHNTNAFRACSNLKTLNIGNQVKTIPDYAFRSCTGLTEVTIPNSVTTIGGWAFYGCTGLTEVTIGNSVTSIGKSAFYNCIGLTAVTIPNSVTTIGVCAFDDCSGLNTIVSLNTIPPTCASNNSFYNYSSTTLYVPKDSYAKYFIDEVWGLFSIINKIETVASSISLSKTSLTLDKNISESINATIVPSNTTLSRLMWTSDNPQVAIVDQSGKITAIGAGTATISVKAMDGSDVSASCIVTVIGTTVTISQTEAILNVNDIMTLTYIVGNSTNSTATWSTSNADVAPIKVNSDGSVTIVGMADGVATITATANDGSGASASCVVTVLDTSGISDINGNSGIIEIARYDIYGRLLTEPTKGINIVKYSNGASHKEVVR